MAEIKASLNTMMVSVSALFLSCRMLVRLAHSINPWKNPFLFILAILPGRVFPFFLWVVPLNFKIRSKWAMRRVTNLRCMRRCFFLPRIGREVDGKMAGWKYFQITVWFSEGAIGTSATSKFGENDRYQAAALEGLLRDVCLRSYYLFRDEMRIKKKY